jgi:DNA-binding transcriptional MerR regulator
VIRWYTTIGLVDRPVMQGRTALYGTRHLAQIVAVKRRQAEGLSLADIQGELAGAPDDTLRRIAGVSDGLLTAEPAQSPDPQPAPPAPGRRTRFWADAPAAAALTADLANTGGHADSVSTLSAVRLAGGAFILLPGRPDHDDVPAIQAAAQPLLDLLANRGLLLLEEGNPT